MEPQTEVLGKAAGLTSTPRTQIETSSHSSHGQLQVTVLCSWVFLQWPQVRSSRRACLPPFSIKQTLHTLKYMNGTGGDLWRFASVLQGVIFQATLVHLFTSLEEGNLRVQNSEAIES